MTRPFTEREIARALDAMVRANDHQLIRAVNHYNARFEEAPAGLVAGHAAALRALEMAVRR